MRRRTDRRPARTQTQRSLFELERQAGLAEVERGRLGLGTVGVDGLDVLLARLAVRRPRSWSGDVDELHDSGKTPAELPEPTRCAPVPPLELANAHAHMLWQAAAPDADRNTLRAGAILQRVRLAPVSASMLGTQSR